jgi:hypothetical protein
MSQEHYSGFGLFPILIETPLKQREFLRLTIDQGKKNGIQRIPAMAEGLTIALDHQGDNNLQVPAR